MPRTAALAGWKARVLLIAGLIALALLAQQQEGSASQTDTVQLQINQIVSQHAAGVSPNGRNWG
jgi:hypothetical protein